MRLIDKSSPMLNRPGARLFHAPTGQPEDVKVRQVGVVGMPSDWTHSSRIGTRFGPDSLRRSTSLLQDQRPKGRAFDPDLNLWSVPSKDWIIDCGDACIRPDDVAVTTEAIARMTETITLNGGVPLALGGDHYNSYPACLGFSRGLSVREPNARFGFIQIDGHLDFSDRLGAWGSYNHATNARRISELPNVSMKNMVWIGVTGWVDSNEVNLIESQGGKIFSSGMYIGWVHPKWQNKHYLILWRTVIIFICLSTLMLWTRAIFPELDQSFIVVSQPASITTF